MGKPKRFNTYDSAVSESRKLAQSYGQARQNLSISSSFRSSPLSPPIATILAPVIATPGSPGGVTFPVAYPVDDQGNQDGVLTITHSLTATTAHKLQFTATGDCDITITGFGLSNASASDFYIEVTQDSFGGHAITVNDSEWIDFPTLSTTADTTSLIACHADGDGNMRAITLLNAAPTSGNSATKELDNLTTTALNTDIHMNTFDIDETDRLLFDQATGDTLLSTDVGITSDAAGGLNLNVITGGDYSIDINGSPIVNIASTEVQIQGGVNLDLNGNDLVFGTGTGEFMDHGASSNIRTYVGGAHKMSFDATGQLMESGYRLTMDDEIRFTGITKPGTNTSSKIYAENLANDDLVLNAATSGDIRMDIAGVEAASFGAAESQIGNISQGYNFNFLRNDATPLDNDEIANITFIGNSWTGALGIPYVYATMIVTQPDVTESSADGRFELQVLKNSTLRDKFIIQDDEFIVESDTTTDLIIHRAETTPATGIIGEFRFATEDSTSIQTDFFYIQVWADVVTNGSEDADIQFKAINAGTEVDFLRYDNGGLTILDSATEKLGFYGTAEVAQQANIVNADGTLADITTKFNALLAQYQALGLQA